MKNNIYTFLRNAEKTLKSLEGDKFDVKGDDNLGYNIYVKRVVVVSSLPEKSVAEKVAQEYNDITRCRKEAIEKVIDNAKNEIESSCATFATTFGDAMTKARCGGSERNEEAKYNVQYGDETVNLEGKIGKVEPLRPIPLKPTDCGENDAWSTPDNVVGKGV